LSKIDIKSLFLSLQEQMTAKLSTNREMILHPGAKGDASELNWIEWFQKYLPKRYSVNKAFVIDCEGNISEQIDVVIYDQQYSPFIFNQDSVLYIPAESVYAIFEVKQELNKQYIEYAGEKAASVRRLKRTSAIIPHAGGHYAPKTPFTIQAGILTLSSSWNPPIGESLEAKLRRLPENQRLNLGCILQGGAFQVNYINDSLHIEKSTPEESLIFFFLKLFEELQKMGTTPALDVECYAKALDSI
jgi:hypothetical protein